MDLKLCRKCGESKPVTDFHVKNREKGTLTAHCKSCNNKRSKNHYLANKGDYYNRRDRHKEEIRDWYREYKKTLKCSKCQEDHPACLDFHHTDPNEKDLEVSQCIGNGWGKESILKEIEKCVVLCANCHRKEHFYLEK